MLVVYRAADFAPLDSALTGEERVLAGLGGVDAPRVLRVLDPIPGVDEGVEVWRHPEVWLAGEPELWAVVDQYRVCAGSREMTLADYETRSNWWSEAWLTMRAAHQREEKRELDAMREGARG